MSQRDIWGDETAQRGTLACGIQARAWSTIREISHRERVIVRILAWRFGRPWLQAGRTIAPGRCGPQCLQQSQQLQCELNYTYGFGKGRPCGYAARVSQIMLPGEGE